MTEKDILLIGETKEYLFLSLEEKLAEASYHIRKSDPNINEINNGLKNCWIIVIYASDRMIVETSILSYIRDKIIERDIPLFVVGDKNQIDVLKITIYEHLIEKEFLRPINITEMVEYFDDYLKHYKQSNRKKVLVVDDSGTVLRNVKSWLGKKYSVEVANSGAMAIKNMTLKIPDLILLDYEMPLCDGPQVFRMIKEEPDFKDIPIIFLTARSDSASVLRCLSLKPEGYLLKSMSPDQIKHAIDDFFINQKLEKKHPGVSKLKQTRIMSDTIEVDSNKTKNEYIDLDSINIEKKEIDIESIPTLEKNAEISSQISPYSSKKKKNSKNQKSSSKTITTISAGDTKAVKSEEDYIADQILANLGLDDLKLDEFM